MPNSSWVAKWNNLEGMQPGIYAINILEDSPDVPENHFPSSSKQKQKTHNHDTLLYSDDEEGYYK